MATSMTARGTAVGVQMAPASHSRIKTPSIMRTSFTIRLVLRVVNLAVANLPTIRPLRRTAGHVMTRRISGEATVAPAVAVMIPVDHPLVMIPADRPLVMIPADPPLQIAAAVPELAMRAISPRQEYE